MAESLGLTRLHSALCPFSQMKVEFQVDFLVGILIDRLNHWGVCFIGGGGCVYECASDLATIQVLREGETQKAYASTQSDNTTIMVYRYRLV